MIILFKPGAEYRKQCPLATAERYEFGPGVNLIVGANGCGKSTLLYAMRKSVQNEKWGDLEIARSQETDEFSLRRFDFEKENPRIMTMERAALNGTDGFSGFMSRMTTPFMSHGQSQRKIFSGLAAATERTIVFLDEPEQGMDHHGMMELATTILAMKARQVIISTHSPYLFLNPAFRVVELTPGYVDSVKAVLRYLLK